MMDDDDDNDLFDLSFLLIFLDVLSTECIELELELQSLLEEVIKEEGGSFKWERQKPRILVRKNWYDLTEPLSDILYRRLFRMPRETFGMLCSMVKEKVGEEEFKSADWISSDGRSSKVSKGVKGCALDPVRGLISGEMKLGMMIRILSGASYLDLCMVYSVASSSVFNAFHEAIAWINSTFSFPLVEWLREKNTEALQRISDGFAAASGDVFKGVIGAIDGLAIKIRCPTLSDEIADPGNYYCRKGFYALNAQVICDKFRRVLWISTGHKGSTHDSTAFLGTDLYKLLKERCEYLLEHGLFLVGDTAYPLLTFLMVPFPKANAGSEEDAFNFWLSNSRIQIECTFGENVMRWGIFWRKMSFDLFTVGKIVNAAFLIHNYLIDERERCGSHKEDAAFFHSFSLREQDCTRRSGEHASPVATDNNEPAPRGRPPTEILNQLNLANNLRERLCADLTSAGLGRRYTDSMKFNEYGQVYF
jgi:hypothetical protein